MKKVTDNKEQKICTCYGCGKKSLKMYNFTKRKWSREFKCKCGSESFRWLNWDGK